MATSAIGSYIAAYILGCRDRHWDNILINTKTACLFHIDFGHILGHKVNY